MDNTTVMVASIAIIFAIVLAVLFSIRNKRSKNLQEKFGPEYDLAMAKDGNKRSNEKELSGRVKHVTGLTIHDLNSAEKVQYQSEWLKVQSDFVDVPAKAVGDANRLITEVMIARGFPVNDFDQRAADVSVLYPDFVANYRKANAITEKTKDNKASTEELRQAVVSYRSLFQELLGTPEVKVVEPEKEAVLS
jgi:hypothetical protein